MKLKEIGEFALIEKIKKIISFKDENVLVGIGDDASAIKTESFILLFTTDMLVEDIHFKFKYTSPFNLGYKAIAVNISDIAAMGGIPTYCLISLGIKKIFDLKFVKELYRGMKKIAENFKVKIVGGDTVQSEKLIINVSLLGGVEKENLITRDKASVGDLILVTGNLGDSNAGLYLLNKKIPKNLLKESKILKRKHLLPIPRLREARILARSKIINSMIDISDGLSGDLKRICETSKVGAKIYQGRIPISSECKKIAKFFKKDPLEFALYGGEEYELLFTVPYEKIGLLQNLAKENNLYLSIIGEITKDTKIKIVDFNKKEKIISDKSYNHFTS